jgi:hypothetical protein
MTEAPENPEIGAQYRIGNVILTWDGSLWSVEIPGPTDEQS